MGIIRVNEGKQANGRHLKCNRAKHPDATGQILLEQMVSQRKSLYNKRGRSVSTGGKVAARSQEDWPRILVLSLPAPRFCGSTC